MDVVLRKEVKYLLKKVEAKRLQNKLNLIMELDGHSIGGGYLVRSLYFDTINDKDFQDKEDGISNRRKIRLRIYDTNASFANLELKQKTGDNQKKRSLIIKKEDAKKICNGEYDCLLCYEEPFAKELCAIMQTEFYRPKSIVEYDRIAYIAKENNIRITFDQNIRATESNFDIFDEHLNLYPVFDKSVDILEVKYNGFLLTYIKDILNEVDKSSLSVSKYSLSRKIKYRYLV